MYKKVQLTIFLLVVILFFTGNLTAALNPFCGINVRSYDPQTGQIFLNDYSARTIRDMGIKWIRVEFVGDPLHGKVPYKIYDQIINMAKKYKLKILGVFSNNLFPLREKAGWNDWSYLISWALNLNDTVTRYKGKVKAWEIWDEPNSEDHALDVEFYGAYLFISYRIVKSIDPEAKVILGSMMDSGENYTEQNPFDEDSNLIKQIYNSYYVQYHKVKYGVYPFDYIAIKPYPWGKLEAQDPYNYLMGEKCIGKVVNILNDMKDYSTKIWITEIGWNTLPSAEKTINSEKSETENIETLGVYIHDMLDLCYRIGYYSDRIDKVFYSQLQDYKDQHYGIIDKDYIVKRAAFRSLKHWTFNNLSEKQ
jgi:hypothetical protein